MKLSSPLEKYSLDYPRYTEIPENVVDTLNSQFKPKSRYFPILEQFGNEKKPHKVRHINYQFGHINNQKAIRYSYKRNDFRLTYSNQHDRFLESLIEKTPPRTKFPLHTAPSPIARSLREFGLKWIANEFFNSLYYDVFDEPLLENVNPDLLVIPRDKSGTLTSLCAGDFDNSEKCVDLDIRNSLFVEIKAFHGETIVGEKEVMQSYNYAVLGGKAMLLTTGLFGNLESLKILNDSPEMNEKKDEDGKSLGYDKENYSKFMSFVKSKFRKRIRSLDLTTGQDNFDNRGIYISASQKIQKMHKYTLDWPSTIEYELLSSPTQILSFLTSSGKLGLVDPQAFHELLQLRKLHAAADLFHEIQTRYIEEIMLNPPLLYPKIE